MSRQTMIRPRARAGAGGLQEATAVRTFISTKVKSEIRAADAASKMLPKTPLTESRLMRTVFLASLVMSANAYYAQAQVPAVVANSTTKIASGFSAGPAVVDACGDVYVYEGGGTGIVRIDAITGNVTTVVANKQGYQSSGPALFMDAAKQNVYFPDFNNFYTTHFDQLSIVNCQPGTLNTTFANNLGNLGNYYWGTARDVAGDAAGDVFFITTANVTQAIYKEAFNSSSNSYTDSQVITWKNSINWIAADAAGDLFFSDNKTSDVYELPLVSGAYASTPSVLVAGSSLSSVSGLSFDPQGNLYITDSKASLVYEVPLEKGSLNPADLFAVASVGAPFKAAVDSSHNLYLSNYYPGAAKVSIGSATAPPTSVGSTGSAAITYLFNGSVTPTGIAVYTGTSVSGPFSVGGGGSCIVGGAQSNLTTCTVNVNFNPAAVGNQTGAVAFTTGSGTVLTYVSGIGQGAALTIDPGTVVPFTASLKSPSGIALDNRNQIYVTDSVANTLTLFASASGAGTTVSTGSITLKAPKGVAVDSVGNIFIADSGNNRIIEVPVIGGVLTNASTAVLPSLTLKNPQGVALDGAGNLVIADTGDNTLLLVPNINGSLSFAAIQTIASSLAGPNALAFDQNGNLYVTESGNNDLLEFAAPLGSAAGVRIASGFTTPTSVAADASNSIFVVDSGNGNIYRFPLVSGAFGAKSLVGATILNPIGVAADSGGNLYVTDSTNNAISQLSRVKASLQFGGVNVGTTGTQTSYLSNSGNQPLIFSSPDYTVGANPAVGFSVTNDACIGATIYPGASCSITATFTPPALQPNAEEDLNLLANGANGLPVLQLIGTGAQVTPSTLTLTLTSPAGATSLNAAQAVSFTAQVGTGTNTAVPGGLVKFYVNGTQVGTSQVKKTSGSYTAVFSLSGGLPSGNPVVVSAVYSGDVINYSSSTAQLNEVVNALGDSVTLAINSSTTIFNTPTSIVDDSSVITGFSLTRSGGVVTAKLSGKTTTLMKGAAVSVTSSGDSSFNGVYLLTAVTNTSTSSVLTWQQGGSPADVGSGVSATISARQDLANGPAVPLTATVKPSGTISPTGTVSFYAGTTLLGIASVTPGTYQASITTTALRAGTSNVIGNGVFISNYNLTAVYSGDSIYASGTSNAVPLAVVAPPFNAPSCALTGSNGSAPTCQLNTTGAGFSISPSNPTITIPAGQTSGSVTLTVTSYGGWSGVLNFTCSGLPAYATCNPFPGAPVVNASTSTSTYPQTTVTFTINKNVPPQETHTSSIVWWLSAITGACLLLSRRRLGRAGYLVADGFLSIAGLLLLLGGSVFGILGCSSGVSQFVTPAGSTPVSVTVHAAQLVPGTTTGQVQLQDGNVPPFAVNLVVQ